MDLYNNHKTLFTLALCLFVFLTLLVAIFPALSDQRNNAPLPQSKPLTAMESAGRDVFIQEGCTACHTQQVRNVDMDKIWGSRPGIAADYARNKRIDAWHNATNLMGSERTGPDLTNIGNRQPSNEWNLLHLYNPRSVVSESIMPSYEWLFEKKDDPFPGDVVVNVPEGFKDGYKGKIVASEKALQLVAYLKSLKQVPLPDGKPAPLFLYGKEKAELTAGASKGAKNELDGEALYAANCQSCHQSNGQGLLGAFPPLKGSKVVLDDNPEVQVTIIMKGYNGRVSEGYSVMPPIGTNNNLKPEEVAAIVNHERSSWGNNGKKVTVEQVQKIINSLGSSTLAAK